jgi:hypothetical protein
VAGGMERQLLLKTFENQANKKKCKTKKKYRKNNQNVNSVTGR